MVGTIQATEVIKLLLGAGEPLIGRLMLADALTMKFREWKVPRDPDCPVCGDTPTQTTLIDYEAFCGVSGEDNDATGKDEMSVRELKDRRVAGTAPFLLDVRQPFELEIASIGANKTIPLDELQTRLDELAGYKEAELVVHCKSGGRSAKAVQLLKEAGFQHARNLTGGTLAWSDEIDSNVPKY